MNEIKKLGQHVENIAPHVLKQMITDARDVNIPMRDIFPDQEHMHNQQPVPVKYSGQLSASSGKWDGTALHMDSKSQTYATDYASRDGCREHAIREMIPLLKEYIQKKMSINVLFTTAGSNQGVMNDHAYRNIQQQLNEALGHDNVQDKFNIRPMPAARYNQLDNELRAKSFRPDVFHFYGHSDETGVWLLDEKDELIKVTLKYLTGVIALQKTLKCVLLTGCVNHEIAKQLCQYVPFVIGTLRTITNKQAIAFSAQFYRRIATGDGIREAFTSAHLNAMGPTDEQDLFELLSQDPHQDLVLIKSS